MLTAFCFVSYISIYTIFQEFLILKLYKVNEKRKKCAVIVLIYTVLFLSLEFYLGRLVVENTDAASALAYNICHMIYTFVTLTVIAVYVDGFFPRNFIKIFLYYDVLTTLLYGTFGVRVMNALFKPEQLQGSIYHIDSMDQYPVVLEDWVMMLLTLIITYCINKKVDMLIKKIPDKICVVVLALAFISYIVKITVTVFNAELIFEVESTYEQVSMEALGSYMIFLIIMIGGVGAMILIFAKNRRKYDRMILLETNLQREYYAAVAGINRSIRELKHDLSNHLIVLTSVEKSEFWENDVEKYKNQLYDICDDIRKEIDDQMKWKCIESSKLSDREKYEILRYVSDISERYKLASGSVRVETIMSEGVPTEKHTKITIDFIKSPTKRIFIKRNDMYAFIDSIVQNNGGSIKWEGEGKGILEIVV